MIRTIPAAISLSAFLFSGTAFATLIGTEIDVEYVNDSNPAGNASTTVTVEAGSGDAFQFGFLGIGGFGFTIDIEDSFISMVCTGDYCNDTPDLGPVHYIFSGLDWGGTGFLGGVSLDASSDCVLCGASVSLLSATSFEVLLPHEANPDLGDTLLINLSPVHVPEPASLSLLLAGILGFSVIRRRRVAR